MRFEKGRSGNPGARPKGDGEIRELARQRTMTALETLVEIAERGQNESARVAAENAILDRSCGKPAVPVLGHRCPRGDHAQIRDRTTATAASHRRRRAFDRERDAKDAVAGVIDNRRTARRGAFVWSGPRNSPASDIDPTPETIVLEGELGIVMRQTSRSNLKTGRGCWKGKRMREQLSACIFAGTVVFLFTGHETTAASADYLAGLSMEDEAGKCLSKASITASSSVRLAHPISFQSPMGPTPAEPSATGRP
jgi:hypothetical protein